MWKFDIVSNFRLKKSTKFKWRFAFLLNISLKCWWFLLVNFFGLPWLIHCSRIIWVNAFWGVPSLFLGESSLKEECEDEAVGKQERERTFLWVRCERWGGHHMFSPACTCQADGPQHLNTFWQCVSWAAPLVAYEGAMALLCMCCLCWCTINNGLLTFVLHPHTLQSLSLTSPGQLPLKVCLMS